MTAKEQADASELALRPGEGSASVRAQKLALMFQELDRRKHKHLHAALAAAATVLKDLRDDPSEYKLFASDIEAKYGRKVKGSHTSFDLIHNMGSNTDESVRDLGRYVRVVDYMVNEGVNNYLEFLKTHTYMGVLDLAREKTRPNPGSRDRRAVIRVYLTGWSDRDVEAIKNIKTKILFDLHCEVEPGRKPKIAGSPSTYVEVNPPGLSTVAKKGHKQMLKRVYAARVEVDDMLFDAIWPGTGYVGRNG
jgi:hypothetical protein